VTYRLNWGEERVYFDDDAGRLCSVPAVWTSLSPPDPFVVVSAGRSHFRVVDLLELSRLLEGLSPEARRDASEGSRKGV
jgi:hypothetical protein